MKELIVDALKIIAPLAVALIVFTQALNIAPSQVAVYFREQTALMLRALLAMLVLVPAAALALILLLGPPPGLAIALAILVSCPPAPLMLKAAVKKGGGSAAFMASLHLMFAVLAFVTVPAVLYLMSIPLGFNADIDLAAMAWILARTILLPVGLGLVVRSLFPAFADEAGPVLGLAGTIGLLLVVVAALAALYPVLLNTDVRSYLVIAAVSVAALAIGHFLGPSDPGEKTALAVECGVRHPVLALAIAGANFSPQNALPILVPCIVTFIVIAMIYMSRRGKARGTTD